MVDYLHVVEKRSTYLSPHFDTIGLAVTDGFAL
jgi:hypothetical protein